MALIFQPWLSYTVIMTIWMRNQFQPCNANSHFFQLLMAQLRIVIVFLLVVAVGNRFDFGQLFGGQFVRHGEPRLYVGKMKQTLCVVVCLKNAACKV